jgi:ferredoxin
MKVMVNDELCEGHAQCVMIAPDVFDLPEGADHVVVLQGRPPEVLRAEVEEAVAICPVRAISVEG